MRKAAFTLCVFFSLISFSQEQKKEIDSLLNLVNTTKVDSLKVKFLLKLEYAYRYSNYKKGLDYANKALLLSKKNNWQRGIALCYNSIGGNYLDRSEHSLALDNYSKSLQFSKNNTKYRLTTLMNISNIYLREKNFKLSQKYINDAYKIATYLNDEEEIAYCYYQMGLIYRDENKTDESIKYFEKSLSLFRVKNNLFQVAEVTTFLGEVTKDYKLKLAYLLESKLVWDKVAPDYISAINNALLLSKTYLILHGNDSLRKTSDVTKSKSELLNEAETLTTKAIEYSKISNAKQYLMDGYEVLSEIKALKKDFTSAYTFSILHRNLNDSIFSQESKNQIAKLTSQKEIELRDKQIEINKISLKAKEKQKWFLISGIILLGIIGGLLFYQNKNRAKTNTKLQILNTNLDQANKTKNRLLSILNHDLRSPVNSFIHFIQFQKENPEILDNQTKSRIEKDTLSSAKNLLNSMEEILFWTKNQMENFKPQPKNILVSSLFQDTKNHFKSEDKVKISFENLEDIQLYTDENYLKTIIRNLTANAIKALDCFVPRNENENPTVIWKAWDSNNQKILSISDNGKGATSEEFSALYDENEVSGIESGLGLHLIRDLAKAIDCEITVDSKINFGTTFTLKLK